jgi:hypothetical protein
MACRNSAVVDFSVIPNFKWYGLAVQGSDGLESLERVSDALKETLFVTLTEEDRCGADFWSETTDWQQYTLYWGGVI